MSERQVLSQVHAGRLVLSRTVGRSFLIDSASVTALQQGRGRGRRWDEPTTWAALEILQTGSTRRLETSQRSRLKHRLRSGMSVPQLLHQASGRGRLRRCLQAFGTATNLRRSRAFSTSGGSALADENLASRFGLAAGVGPWNVGYVHVADEADVVARFGLTDSSEGNVFLRVTAHHAYIGQSTIALDLVELGNAREHSAGIAHLQGLLR